jgi:hypothetical protein
MIAFGRWRAAVLTGKYLGGIPADSGRATTPDT